MSFFKSLSVVVLSGAALVLGVGIAAYETARRPQRLLIKSGESAAEIATILPLTPRCAKEPVPCPIGLPGGESSMTVIDQELPTPAPLAPLPPPEPLEPRVSGVVRMDRGPAALEGMLRRIEARRSQRIR